MFDWSQQCHNILLAFLMPISNFATSQYVMMIFHAMAFASPNLGGL